MIKICTKCLVGKPISEFHKARNGKYGVRKKCKTCCDTDSPYGKAERQGYKTCTMCGEEKLHEAFCKKKNGRFGISSICNVCESNRKKEYRKVHSEELAATMKVYRERNREKINAWSRNDMRKRRKDSKLKLGLAFSNAIYQAIRRKKNGKPWESLVGYTLDDLKKHLEKRFAIGMSWDNYGKDGWHIDHRIPKSVFNYERPEHLDFQRCWALENLRPLWAKENLSKNNSLIKDFQPSLLM